MRVKIFWFNKKKYTHMYVCIHTRGFQKVLGKYMLRRNCAWISKYFFLQHQHFLKFHFFVNFLKYAPFSPLSKLE